MVYREQWIELLFLQLTLTNNATPLTFVHRVSRLWECFSRKAADTTHGTVSSALTEAIDLAPTFVELAGGTPRSEILEGHSLQSIINGEKSAVRNYVISEYDYSAKGARETLNQPISDCRLAMIYDGRYKLVHAEGYRPMIYDLLSDPEEFYDRAEDPQFTEVIKIMMDQLHGWYRI